jgi:hypothetical protein
VIGNRQRDRDLTIVLLAELAAVLARHADRMPALLGKPRIVDDPRRDRSVPLNRRQHQVTHFPQHPLIRPRRVADKVQQRLMLRRHPSRRRHRRHRLDALPLPRQQKPKAVIPQRRRPVGVTERPHQTLDIRPETRFTFVRGETVHRTLAMAGEIAQTPYPERSSPHTTTYCGFVTQ